MATRLYFSESMAVDITPGFAAFTETDGMLRREMSVNKSQSAMANHTTGQTATGAGSSQGIRQYISPPMAAQTISAGTWKGTILALESGTNDNVDAIRSSLRYWDVSAAGFGGTSLVALGNGTVAEFNATLRAKRIASGGATTSVTVDIGDRLVFDIGYTNTTAGVSISATLRFGDNGTTDLGDNETDTTTSLNPFIELSVDIIWQYPDFNDIFTVYNRLLAQ
jgi:hypothetical protein